jgi:hypothetical protein
MIEHLKPSMISSILTQLCHEDEAIRIRVSQMIKQMSNTVDYLEVANDLFFDLEQLAVEDVWERADSSSYGYVSTEEAAMEMMEEESEPYREEVTNNINLKQPIVAQEHSKGILLGLYRFDHECKSEFKNWASDIAGELFREQFEQWIKLDGHADRRSQMYDFIEKECPQWKIDWDKSTN